MNDWFLHIVGYLHSSGLCINSFLACKLHVSVFWLSIASISLILSAIEFKISIIHRKDFKIDVFREIWFQEKTLHRQQKENWENFVGYRRNKWEANCKFKTQCDSKAIKISIESFQDRIAPISQVFVENAVIQTNLWKMVFCGSSFRKISK